MKEIKDNNKGSDTNDIVRVKGRFAPGQSGNPKGKPKGALDKTTREMKQILNHALFGDEASIAADMALLEPRDRLMMKAKFAPFILPSLKAVESTVEVKGETSLGFSIGYSGDKEDKEEKEDNE